MFEIYLGKNVESFNITYIKLQEIIANIGGFLSLTTFFLTIIANLFNEHYMMNEVINHLFDFSDLTDLNKVDDLLNKKITLNDKIEIIKISKNDHKRHSFIKKNKNVNKNTIIMDENNLKDLNSLRKIDDKLIGNLSF